MKILQVCPSYYPQFGGVEENVRNTSERIAKKHEIIVATTDPSGKLPEKEEVNGIRILRFKSWSPNESYFFSGGLRAYLLKHSDDFDVVHAHNYGTFPALYAAHAKKGNKLIFTPHYHGTGQSAFRKMLHVPYRHFGRRIFEQADWVVCVSNYERNLVMKHFRLNQEKVVLIPNGLSVNEFKRLRKQIRPYRSILYVGRLEKYKGVQYIIKILPKLTEDIRLEIVGKGPFKRNLIRLVAELNLQMRVGFSEDLLRRELLQKYADADLFVQLSNAEAYGICVLEALASRVPCIVANASALREWVDNKNCYGVDSPINLDQLATLTSKTIGKKVDEFKPEFDWDKVAEKLTELYEPS